MCINSNTSISTFIFSLLSSIVLIFAGNKKYHKENLIAGILFIYVAIMQILEYFMWIDLENKKGYNKIATILGPFFNYTQPSIIFIVKTLVLNKYNIFITLINLIYYIYFIFRYSTFLTSEKMITSIYDKHLHWGWEKYFNFYIYIFILILNIFIFINIKYSLLISFFIFTIFTFSNIYFKKHIGEFWCFFISYTPILICIGTYLI